jgi:Mor family transcriptional regulator
MGSRISTFVRHSTDAIKQITSTKSHHERNNTTIHPGAFRAANRICDLRNLERGQRMINMQTNYATSCMDFIRSMAQRYAEMADTPEILTNSDRRSQIDSETSDMHEMHMGGATISSIARKYNLSDGAVRQRFINRDLPIGSTKVEDETREMHKMHMQGASISEVACKYDLTYNIVRNRFAHRKLQINRKNKRAKK